MAKFYKKYFFLSILFLSELIFSQNQLGFDFDYAQFGSDSTSNYVEFYYSFSQNNLTVSGTEGNKHVAVLFNIQISDSADGDKLIDKAFIIENPVTDVGQDVTDKSLIGVVGYIIPAGSFLVTLRGRDAADTVRESRFSEKLKVKPLYSEGFSISDIQLAKEIKNENVDQKSIFYKNTLEVIPNPAILYSKYSPVLFFYTEIYNLLKGDNHDNILMQKLLYNSRGMLLYKKSKTIKRMKNSIVEVGLINLKKYPTDTYNLIFTLMDTITNSGVASTKKFFLYNPDVIDSTSLSAGDYNYLSSEFGVLSEEECDDLFDKSKYIAASNEISQYEKLDSLISKRKYLFQFWKRRDPDQSTRENEFKNEFTRRLNFCENRFRTFNKKGYKTDRGRVYLMSGEPDQIDRYPNETDKKPYEIWYYNSIEGGVIFVFGDLTGFSDYELLHSTKRGEMRDDNWVRRILSN